MNTERQAAQDELRTMLQDVLGLSPSQVESFSDQTPLFGALPELDSLALANLLTEMEDRLEIRIDDDDIDGSLFETFGQLTDFVLRKRHR